MLNAKTDSAGRTIAYTYTLARQLAECRNLRSLRICHQYDNVGRMIFQRYPNHPIKTNPLAIRAPRQSNLRPTGQLAFSPNLCPRRSLVRRNSLPTRSRRDRSPPLLRHSCQTRPANSKLRRSVGIRSPLRLRCRYHDENRQRHHPYFHLRLRRQLLSRARHCFLWSKLLCFARQETLRPTQPLKPNYYN